MDGSNYTVIGEASLSQVFIKCEPLGACELQEKYDVYNKSTNKVDCGNILYACSCLR